MCSSSFPRIALPAPSVSPNFRVIKHHLKGEGERKGKGRERGEERGGGERRGEREGKEG